LKEEQGYIITVAYDVILSKLPNKKRNWIVTSSLTLLEDKLGLLLILYSHNFPFFFFFFYFLC
jgi:hypothetical protein